MSRTNKTEKKSNVERGNTPWYNVESQRNMNDEMRLTAANESQLRRAERRTGKPAAAIMQAAVMTTLAGHLGNNRPIESVDEESTGYWWECAWHPDNFGTRAYFTDDHEPTAKLPPGKRAESHGLCLRCFNKLIGADAPPAIRTEPPHHD